MSDGVVLIGLPGSGKSVVGLRVAALLDRPFVDLDDEIQRLSGMSAAEHIERHGEGSFREVEERAVQRACGVEGAVIATGGGSGLEPLNRWAFAEHGVRVLLDAPVDMLATRLAGDGVARPLLGDDLRAGLARTAKERAPNYRAVDCDVDASGDVESVALCVVEAVRNADHDSEWRTLFDAPFARHHPIGPEQGRLVMGVGLTARSLADAVRPIAGDRAPAVLADRAALAANPALEAALPEPRMCALDGGEEIKTFAQLQRVVEWLSGIGVERSDALVVAGGGTIGDLGGLAAALHRRGIPLVNVPTTWLAQADSAIGGKVAVDLPIAKNGVGTFWPAWTIVSDARLPRTQTLDRRRDGLVECLKAGLIGDARLWRLVEERGPAALVGDDPAAAYALTERAARLKLAICERDPFETGERRTLNLGHTIGHALEIESGYSLTHGAAVALGLRAVAHIAKRRGAQPNLAERIDSLLGSLGLPMTRGFDAAAVKAAIGGDKKRERGLQRWILPMAVGEIVEVSDVSDAELDAALGVIQT
jgi:shikimate kinase/3-dehydroquinate synthase